jgi:hypothetical protein
MGALPVAHSLALTAAFLPCRRPAAHGRCRRRRYRAVVAYMEPNPNSPAAIAGRLVGALPIVGLVARILNDEGGVGGDIIDFAEFRRRVSKKCTVMDSKAFYDFNQRRGKVLTFRLRSPLCLVAWCLEHGRAQLLDGMEWEILSPRRWVGQPGDPFYVLLCCWLAAIGAGLLKTEEILEGVARLRISNDIEFEEETFIDMMRAAKEVITWR